MKINKLKILLIFNFYFIISLCSEIQCIDVQYMVEDELINEPNSSIWERPGGPEEWKDQYGNYAPPQVRKAANALWESVELEGKAAFDDGYGVTKNLPCCGSQRCFWAFGSCGGTECYHFLFNRHSRTNLEFGCANDLGMNFIGLEKHQSPDEGFSRRTESVMKAMAAFKDAVNQSVAEPDLYSGDVDICQLEKWIEDGKWELQLYTRKILSCRRDMSDVMKSTKSFANSHGGWVCYNEEKPV